MQDEFTTETGSRQTSKSKKSGNGKWVHHQDAQMDNEAFTPSTLAAQTSSTPSMPEVTEQASDALGNARQVYDRVVARGSEMLSKVDLSRGTNLVREYPIQASIGGMILGFLLGAVVFRRRE